MDYKERTIILFKGLPGSGKTTLADMLHKLIGGARINADQIRSTISTDLKFSDEDRMIQAHRMGGIAGLALRPYTLTNPTPIGPATLERLNQHAVVDFVCPSDRLFEEFCYSARFFGLPPLRIISVFMDTILPKESRFEDTAKLFQRPSNPNHTVTGFQTQEQLEVLAAELATKYNLKKA